MKPMKVIKYCLYLAFVLGAVYPAITYGRARYWQLKELIDKSDIVASVEVQQVFNKDDMLHCNLLVDGLFKPSEIGDKHLTVIMPDISPSRRPKPVTFEIGARYLVFLRYGDSPESSQVLRLVSRTSGGVHLQGNKTIVWYLLDGNPPKRASFNETELLKRVRWLAAEALRTVREIPMPNSMRSPRDFSWFPDSQKIIMRLAHRIAVVEVESGKVKILSEPNIKHCNPACAPDGRTIAYIGPMGKHSTIWLMDINGDNKRPIANVRCWHRPVWSPDSKRLVFTERNNDIWVVNADGSGLKQLTSGPGSRSRPKWSPDGNLIAFATMDEIWLMNADSSNQKMLTEIVSEPGYGAIGDWDDFFDWSVDSKQIVFSYRPIPPKDKHVTHDGGIHPYQIWIVNVDGSDKRCVTPDNISCGHPIWTPDNRHILFESVYKWVVTKTGRGPYPKRNIWMLDSVEKKRQQLTETNMVTEFTLSPDGKKVVFSTENDRSIFVLENFLNIASQSKDPNPATVDTSNGKQIAFEEFVQTAEISKQTDVRVEGEDKKLGYGAVIELVVSVDSSHAIVDLDTNKTWGPAARGKPRDYQGADIWADFYMPPDAERAYDVLSHQLPIIEEDKNGWNIVATSLVERIEVTRSSDQKTHILATDEDDFPKTFLFKTHEGSMGILQIIGFTQKPKGMRILYKILRKEPSEKSTVQVEGENKAVSTGDPTTDDDFSCKISVSQNQYVIGEPVALVNRQ